MLTRQKYEAQKPLQSRLSKRQVKGSRKTKCIASKMRTQERDVGGRKKWEMEFQTNTNDILLRYISDVLPSSEWSERS